MAKKTPVPYRLIELAVSGDPIGVSYVLAAYRGYIRKLATRSIPGMGGSSMVDEDMRLVIEARLVEQLLRFDLER